MEEKETKVKDSMEYILESLLENVSQAKNVDNADAGDTSCSCANGDARIA
jgi:hypothetical protein